MSGEPQVPEVQDIPAPPPDATSDEQGDYLVAIGQMVEITDPASGQTFLMPAPAAAVATPEVPPPVNPVSIKLDAIAPDTASVASLVNLVATGRFDQSSVILLDGVALPTTYASATELRATIPGGTQTAGEHDVSVFSTGVATEPQVFTYT